MQVPCRMHPAVSHSQSSLGLQLNPHGRFTKPNIYILKCPNRQSTFQPMLDPAIHNLLMQVWNSLVSYIYVENLDCNFGQAVQTWNKWVWVGSNKELIYKLLEAAAAARP